jgi:hypothetical protein
MASKYSFIYTFVAGLTSFDLASDSSRFVKLAKGGNSTVHLVYETPDVASSYSLSAVILSGITLNTSNASIVDNSESVTFTISSSSINSLEYGAYALTLNLIQIKDNYILDTISKELVLYYEEPITNIQVQYFVLNSFLIIHIYVRF